MRACWSSFWAASALVVPLLAILAATDARAQVDSTKANRPAQSLRRAIVPGMGQIHNGHYLKLPLVYAGLGAFTGGALLVNQRYLLYRHAYLYTARTHDDGSPVFPDYAADYAKLLRRLGLPPESGLSDQEIAARRARLEPQLRKQRDNLRRNRDLLYFGIGLWYGLSLLDAYVSAHLLDFDVSEDLALSLHGLPGTVAMRWTF